MIQDLKQVLNLYFLKVRFKIPVLGAYPEIDGTFLINIHHI
jgi:hypothetical protein